jgi:hypothetical protein
MNTSGHPYDQATLTPEERALVPPVEGAGKAIELAWTFRRRQKSLTPTGIGTLDHPAHSLVITDYAILDPI